MRDLISDFNSMEGNSEAELSPALAGSGIIDGISPIRRNRGPDSLLM